MVGTIRMLTPIQYSERTWREKPFSVYGRGDGSALIQFAHNDYLQAVSRGGIVAAALAVWVCGSTFSRLRSWSNLRAPLMRAIALGRRRRIFGILVHVI